MDWLDAINKACEPSGFVLSIHFSVNDPVLPARRTIEGRVRIATQRLRRQLEDEWVGDIIRDIGVWFNGIPEDVAKRHWAMMMIDKIDKAEKPYTEWATTMIACRLVYRRGHYGKTECKTAIDPAFVD